MNTMENQQPVVSIGLDAAVVASHQVAIRGPGVAEDYRVRPTLAGLEELTVRLADWAPAIGGGRTDCWDVADVVACDH